MGRLFKYIVLVGLLVVLACVANAELVSDRDRNVESLNNYLILMLHGTGDGEDCLKATQEYLEKSIADGGLGLRGHVYRYKFSDKFGSIKTWAKELKDWFVWAKSDFKKYVIRLDSHDDYNTIADVPDSMVPSQFILICHSAGGLAARYYVMGRDENGNPLYEGNVKKIITIDTPHLGSQAGEAAIWSEENAGARILIPWTALALCAFPWDYSSRVFVASNAVAATSTALTEGALTGLDRHARQPIVQEQKPNGPFLNELNLLSEVPGIYEAPSYSLIAGKGVPTPTRVSDGTGLVYNSVVVTRFTAALSNALTKKDMGNYEEKISSIGLTVMSGYPFFDDGDLVSSVASQKGEGIASLREAKRYEYTFRSSSIAVLGTVIDSVLAATYFLPGNVSIWIAVGAGLACLPMEDATDYIMAHNAMKDKVIIRHPMITEATSNIGTNDPPVKVSFEEDLTGATMLEEAIFDSSYIGSTSTTSLREIPFILSTNQTKESDGKVTTLSAFHPVEVKGYSYDNRSNTSVPIVIDGQEQKVTSISVKEAPTKISGVLRDFMPSKMQYFQCSENFAAWKPVPKMDEWGNFEVDGLKLAEGQNVIAFRAKNKVGYESNQLLKVILNTIPMQPSQFKPLPEYYVATPNPEISVEFNKAEYSGSFEVESVKIIRVLVDGMEVEYEVEIINDPYHPKAIVRVKGDHPLSDGMHQVLVVAESNVGTAQAAWGFFVDTGAPSLAVSPLMPYSPRAPATIRWSATDEVSPILRSVRCDLYRYQGIEESSNQVFVTNIATADSLSKGENFFTLVPGNLGASLPDGKYIVKIKAFDLAGNSAVAETPLVVDSTPPTIGEVAITPNPTTSINTEMKLTANVSEKAQVIIKLNNLSNKKITAYLTQANAFPLNAYSFPASYSWPFNNSFNPGPEDGLYRVEVIARDDAGNESPPRTLEAIRIDRTPPVIYGQIANPYVLTNIGANAYKTTLFYQLSENNDAEGNKRDQGIKVKVKVFNVNTGQEVDFFENASGLISEENKLAWNAARSLDASIPLPKGSYKFQITATDDVGNSATAYSSCVKDGIAPVISFPAENGAEVFGLIAIRGTAMDPDWSNDKPFKQYRVFYMKGKQEAATILSQASVLSTAALEVPLINRASGNSNVSLRPLQNDATLAYFNTNGLENGEYTIMVVVDEENGESLAATRVVKVNNNSFASTMATSPYVNLNPLASNVDFRADDSVKLPIGFINSVKPANVYVEIIKPRAWPSPAPAGEGGPSAAGGTVGEGGEVVFFKYFPNIAGAPFVGKPDYKPGTDLGYFIWSDEAGYHIRWSADGSSHKFTGNIITIGGNITPLPSLPASGGGEGIGVRVAHNMISWDSTIAGGEKGFDFTADGGQLMITPKLDEDPSPSIYADNVYLGITKQTQQFLPLVIDVANQRLINLTEMGSHSSLTTYNLSLTTSWDGRLDTGAYVDNGAYIVRVIAEGADGRGLASDEAVVNVTTPFELKVKEATNKEFSSLSVPDRVSVFYNVSKDALITARVQKENGDFVAGLAVGKEGLVWTGNYPNSDSTQVVTSGNYKIVLIAAAKDGSGTKTEVIDGIKVVSFERNESQVKLDPIGRQVGNLWLADGDSPFYFEAKGYGSYHPVKDLTYTLTAFGKQKITAYPYVPFAGLMHRGFNRVFGKIKVKFKSHCYRPSKDMFGLDNGQAYTIIDSESDFKIFELSKDNPVYELTFNLNAADWDWQGITGVDALVEVHSESEFLLDKMNDYQRAQWNVLEKNLSTFSTQKGIFKIKLINKQTDNAKPKIIVRLSLDGEIPYSRLTNRFVPWFGFVNANEEKRKDFSEYLTDINRGLGFPGKKFFDDPDAKPDLPYKPKNEIEAEFAGLTSWSDRSAKLKEMSEQASLLGYKDSLASSAGYDSYLSEEYFEFIPITYPDQAGGNRGGLDFSDGSTIVTAHTDLVYLYDGNPQSPFIFSWPWRESEYATAVASQTAQQRKLDKELGGEPQNYTGPTIAGTWWKLDLSQVNQRRIDQNNSAVFTGQVYYNKTSKRGEWSSQAVDQLLPLPNYVYDKLFQVESNTPGIMVSLSSSAPSAVVNAEDQDISGFPWTTADDTNLLASRGYLRSLPLAFNPDAFRSRRLLKLSSAYQVADDYRSAAAAKQTFLKRDPWEPDNFDSPVDNPHLEIDRWDVLIKDKSGAINKDIVLEGITAGERRLDDTLALKLKLDASESRFVEITGQAPGPYELQYYDGKSWQSIAQSFDEAPTSGRLAWWNVSRLSGDYTVLLRSGSFIATQNVSIGTLIKKETGGDAWSAYKRAQLKFPPRAFGDRDQLATVTPVTMKEIKIRNKPIILTSGPIVEIKPSPWKFTVSSLEGVDLRPTLRFIYTFDELKELGAWSGEGEPKNLPWNIHQVTEAGDLQIISDNQQTIEENNGEKQYVFYAALDHFSTYALLPGKFKLSAPIVLADRYVTNKNSVTIYGTAEPGSVLNLIVRPSPATAGEGGPSPKAMVDEGEVADEDGNFRFENVPLLQEGANYIYVTSHPQGNPDVLTCGDVMVMKDTAPPTVGIVPNLYAFSPNGDGKYDSVDFLMTINEKGKIYLGVKESSDLINIDAPLPAGKELKVNWSNEGFKLYRRDDATGLWALYSQVPNPANLIDGEYSVVGYAIDEAGNISENVMVKTVIDLTPPKVLGLNAAPNPFTPNDDGVKDTTDFWYKLSEPSAVKLGIYREDGELFKNAESQTEKFQYPNLSFDIGHLSFSSGSWSWDGRGNSNELLGGNYSYYIYAEDWVGNSVTSEIKAIVVDRAPTLISYLFAEPDPFSPASGAAIKYYLSRDDLKVNLAITGEQIVTTLLKDASQGKGEHAVYWSGRGGDGEKVSDGSYLIKLAVIGSDGISAEASNTVRVDGTAPTVILRPVQIDGKQATVTFMVPEDSTVDVTLTCDDGKAAPLMTCEAKTAGEYKLIFDEEAVGYRGTVTVRAVDRSSNEATASEKFAFAAATILDHLADPAIFTPNGDGHTDTIRIAYQLSGGTPPYIVNVDVVNAIGTTIRRLAENDEQSSGSYSFYWDGKSIVLSSAETYVPDGEYHYQITATDADGVKVEASGRLEAAGGKITPDFTLNPAAFSPNGDDNNETMTINYSVIYPPFYVVEGEPSVLLSVLSANGEILFETGLERSSGSYSYVYDGRTNYPAAGLSSGSLLPTGKYYAKITIQDRLGTITSLTKDFAVDVTNPMVIISSEEGMIANPGSFSTNANPDGSDRPRATTLYYMLTEDTLVSVKVYRLDPNKQKTDFTNLVTTLIAGQWQSGGQQYQVNWDGKMAGGDYVDPGKYAFIVEGEDSLGNATLRKWGGTVWVQNNVLTLRSPEQFEASDVTNNPDPQVISPNGNSQEFQKRARFYFMVDLSLNPATVPAAERIEAMGVTIDTKPVGKYSLKVYGDSAMTSLVRTITTDAVAQSGTLSWEDWDGKDNNGSYAANGKYWLAIDLEDYAGNHLPPLTGEVTVDNSLPEVKNVLATPYYFAPGGTNSSGKTTVCTYEVSDNSGRAKVAVEVFKGNDLVKSLTSEVWRTSGSCSALWDGSGATGYVGAANGSGFGDGEYYFNIIAIDEAGNNSTAQTVSVVADTLAPDGSVIVNAGNPDFTSSLTVEVFVSASDPTSGVDQMSFSPDGINWSSWEAYAVGRSWTLSAGDGTKTARVRLMDRAGNYSTALFADQIVLDSAAPVIKSVVQPPPVTVNNPTTTLLGVMADFNGGADAISGINNWQIKIVNAGGGLVKTFGATAVPPQTGDLVINQEWEPTGHDGYYYYYYTATDAAGNSFDSRKAGYGAYKPLGGEDTYYRILVDKTPPAVNISAPAANEWIKGSIIIAGSATDTNPGAYKVDYAPFGSNTWTVIKKDSYPISGTITSWNTAGVDGDYDIRLSATDEVGNYAETKITIKIDNIPPVINIIQTLAITFNPYVDSGARVDFTASDGAPSSGFAIGNISSVVRFGSAIVKNLTVNSNGSGGYYVSWDGTNNSGDYENEGSYSIEIGAVDNIGNNAITRNIDINLLDDQRLLQHSNVLVEITGFDISTQDYMTLQWHDGPDNNPYYEKGCGKEYQAKIVSAAVNPRSGIVPKSANYSIDNYRHIVSISNGNIYYKRIVGNDIYGPVKVFNGGNATDVAICAENNNSSYIAWIINIGQFDELFFQKIPINFAPITGTKLGASAITKGIMAAATLESPSLIAPARDQQNVQNIRPVFEWQHHKAETTEYRIEVAKNDSFTIDHQTFSKAAGTGTQDKADSELYYYNYAIHEFDPGLERNTDYFWRVTALFPTNAATSESWSFRVQPELTLVGVTNYPNPFNPNREETKIRYRLSSDADEVKIRIYDLTGSLVTELDGTTNGEGTSVWQKYNDVSWDGRNGRGDLVVNGIYPFEVTARIGDRTVRGRGKIAVLK